MESFSVVLTMISDVIGMGVKFTKKNEIGVTVTTTTNKRAMEQFVLNFSLDAIVLKPEGLRGEHYEGVERSDKGLWVAKK